MIDYALPRAAWFPNIELDETVTPSPVNPLGVKGVGEAGTIASTAAVANAVNDALRAARHQPPRHAVHAADGLVRDPGREGRPGMIPAAFDYVRPGSIEEAAQAAGQPGAKVIAGGQSLLPLMKLRLARPTTLVDIGRIAGLVGTRYTEDGGAEIGALTTYAQVMDETQLEWARDAVANIGDVQVRNRGTIGGSVAHADPASDAPAILLALDYSAVLRSARGERVVPLDGFFTGAFTTTAEADEILVAVRRPRLPDGVGGAYEKLPVARFRVRHRRRGRGHRAERRLDQPRPRRADRGGGSSVPGEGGGVGARRLGRLCLGDCRGRGARHRRRVGQFGHPCQCRLSFSDGRGSHPSRDRGRPRPQRLIRRSGTGAPRTGHARPERARPSCRRGPRPRPEDR